MKVNKAITQLKLYQENHVSMLRLRPKTIKTDERELTNLLSETIQKRINYFTMFN